MARDIKKTVTVHIDDIVKCEGVDEFNDLLCELTGEPGLMDISWESVNEIKLVVTGYVEDE